MTWPLPVICLTLLISSSALGQEACGSCFQLNTGTIIGIVICDSLITLVIAGMAFWISNRIQKKKFQDKLQKLKNTSPTNESAYEELHGQKLHVYNDLNSLRQ
ncbi:TYRO protein tyrosine kinase-binding protein [Dendropsophus ebraccatus]|uniref:TYRO protein tyrosine kinase-binding protein n=1 Tax=Dendropsophus ebraccatus TaxID=150705 RepID=UPI003831E0C2